MGHFMWSTIHHKTNNFVMYSSPHEITMEYIFHDYKFNVKTSLHHIFKWIYFEYLIVEYMTYHSLTLTD